MAISQRLPANKILATFFLITLALPNLGSANSVCEPHKLSGASGKTWSGPLARVVSIRVSKQTLKDALERVAKAANVRVSYSAELLPLEREVCIDYRAIPAGDALNDLLQGVAVQPVIASADHIVLAPASQTVAAAPEEVTPVYPVQPVFATATAVDPNTQLPSLSITVLHAADIAQHTSIAEALNSTVPGMRAWRSPTGFATVYNVRGASSFSSSAPKIYIDGIEVANPLLLTEISPDIVDRIEIIRGPQGAAVYGGDALSGVTNIVTRHAVSGAGLPRVHVKSGLTFGSSDFTNGTKLGQDQSLSLSLGSAALSGNIDMGMGSTGQYLPGGYVRHFSGDGSFRAIGQRTSLSGTARFFSQSAGNPASMLTNLSGATTPLSMQQFTIGFNGVYQSSERVRHSLVAGIDGYALSATDDSIIPRTPVDSILRAAGNGGTRTTLRASTVVQMTDNPMAKATVTMSADYSGLTQHGDGRVLTPFNQSRSARSAGAQMDLLLFERLSLNSGLRLQHDVIDGNTVGASALPMVGASYIAGNQDVTVKLRTAYGKAVHWPDLSTHYEAAYQRTRMPHPALSPEQQSGIEAGIDFSYRQKLGFQITRYDQSATGLTQVVPVKWTQKPPPQTYTTFWLQNVGEVANTGWELQGYARFGAFALNANMALTQSHVRGLSSGYIGDLRAGDRMLGVPARTIGLTTTWTGQDWSTSLSASRAFDWINYDRAAISQLTTEPGGADLRAYWLHYNGFTHLRTTVTRSFARGVSLLLTADNLLDKQVGEPDNLTVVPGRTFSFGVRAAF